MKNIAINIVIQVLLLSVFFLLIEEKKEKTAFVRLDKVYEDFELKKDLELKFKNIESKRKSILDSLELELRLLYQKVNKANMISKESLDEYETKKEVFFVKKQQFSEDNQKVMDQYHSQIITKINDYASSYGKLNHYEYVFGTDGAGSLMYSDENKDVTTDFLKFINNSYKTN